MPIYEYRCQGCRQKFEQLVRSSRKADKGITCPKCGSQEVERQLSAFSAGQGDAGSASIPESCMGCPSAGGSCPNRPST